MDRSVQQRPVFAFTQYVFSAFKVAGKKVNSSNHGNKKNTSLSVCHGISWFCEHYSPALLKHAEIVSCLLYLMQGKQKSEWVQVFLCFHKCSSLWITSWLFFLIRVWHHRAFPRHSLSGSLCLLLPHSFPWVNYKYNSVFRQTLMQFQMTYTVRLCDID